MNVQKICTRVMDIILVIAVIILLWHVIMPESWCWLKAWQYFTLLIIAVALVSPEMLPKKKK